MIAPTRREGERGAAALSLLTVAIIVAIGIFAFMAIPLTDASDAKAKSRSAADAAALAGVEYVKKDLEIALTSNGWMGSWRAYEPLIGGGATSASSYAEQNDGELVGYQGPTPMNGWESYAKVRGRDVEGQENTSEARAKLDLPECTVEEAEPTEPTEPSSPPAGNDEEKKAKPEQKLTCGGTSFQGVDLKNLPASLISQLIDESHARLIG
ncbi:hypothetical protein [Aeromicrobium sp.]|uniref:hypothetical protein n=1 Tax=Aeromicrobium sp. TaxID=1871063 RepID=UPI003D6B4DFC